MSLMKLPLELFDAILLETARARGLKRSLRLRLVNRAFSARIVSAIYAARLMDHLGSTYYTLCPPLVRQYIEYRLHADKANTYPTLGVIRRIATILVTDTTGPEDFDRTYRSNVSELCNIISVSVSSALSQAVYALEHEEDRFQYDLLTAAAALNKVVVFKRVLEERGNLDLPVRVIIGLFGSPAEVAAEAGHNKILDLISTFTQTHWCCSGPAYPFYRGNALERAAMRGQVKTVGRILNSKWWPWDCEHSRSDRRDLDRALSTGDVGIIKMAMAARRNTPLEGQLSAETVEHLLCVAIRKGWEDMTRHLLPLRKPLRNVSKTDDWLFDLNECRACSIEEALCAATLRGYTNVVRIVLDLGVSAEGLLPLAAIKGHFSLVKMLVIEYRVDIDSCLPHPLASAIQVEHERMVRFLAGQGATIATAGQEALGKAQSLGLESMVPY